LATLDIFESDNVLEKNRQKAQRFSTRAAAVATHALVENFRQKGMIWAFDVKCARPTFAREFFAASLRRGVLLRPIGKTVYFMPPYVIEEDEFSGLVEQTIAAINEVCSQ
jgi:adenosylmethionine-8-amino-7-oxononanoate aminotransferase